MKTLFIVLALFVAGITSANAQAFNLTVNNNTGCTVYFLLRGSNAGTCTIPNSTPVIAVAAGSVGVSFNAGTLFGMATAVFNRALIFDTDVSGCPVTATFIIGQPCSTPNTVTPLYTIRSGAACISCATPVSATWTPAAGGTATLDFN